MFWRSTPYETVSLARRFQEVRRAEERNAFLRAGIVASAVINSNPYRKRGARMAKPTDFLPKERRPTKIVSADEAWKRLSGWAKSMPSASPELLARYREAKRQRRQAPA